MNISISTIVVVIYVIVVVVITIIIIIVIIIMCRWWRHAWHAYKSKPCTLELKPPPACSLACQVSYFTVPPFGKTQAGTHVN